MKKDRSQYQAMLNILRKGDVVVVWRIDRLGRTTLELIKFMVELCEKGIEFKSITEGIDNLYLLLKEPRPALHLRKLGDELVDVQKECRKLLNL